MATTRRNIRKATRYLFNFRRPGAPAYRALAIAGFDEFPITNRPALDFVAFSYDVTFPLPWRFGRRSTEHSRGVFARFSVENFRLAETESTRT